MAIQTTPFGGLPERLSAASETPQLDAVDLRLIESLLGDGRATLKHLAEEVGLSAPAVSERMSRLQSEGVIRGYTVDVDWGRLGYTMTAYISVVIRPNFNRSEVIRGLQRVPCLEETSVVTGSSDLILRVRTTGFEHLKSIIADHLWARDDLEFTETKIAFFSEESDALAQERIAHIRAQMDRG